MLSKDCNFMFFLKEIIQCFTLTSAILLEQTVILLYNPPLSPI